MARYSNKGRKPSQMFVEVKEVKAKNKEGKVQTYYDCKQKLYVADGYGITLDLSNLVNKDNIVETQYGTQGIYIKFWPNYPKGYMPKPKTDYRAPIYKYPRG